MKKQKSSFSTVYEAWAKQNAAEAARQERARPFEPGEVVDIAGSQEEIKKAKVWDPFSLSNFSPVAGTSSASAVQYMSEENLKDLGYNNEAGRYIVYPIGEFMRPYEQILIKKCLSLNTCISLPLGVSPAHIIALTFANFSRWFPNSHLVCCCNSTEASESFKNACISVGFSENEVTIVPNYVNYKKKESQIGKVVITTAQCLLKMVESESAMMSNMRCMAINLEPNEPLTKYNKFVGPLVTKGFSFRLLTTVPSFPDGSRRCSSISKRQQMITSLFISQWEEPRSTNPAFRLAAVPTGLQRVFWSDADQYSNNLELLRDWTEGFNVFMKDFPSSVPLPSQEIDQLINLDWKEIQKQAREVSTVVLEQCNIAGFLVTAYRNLLLSGVRLFYLFCKDTLNAETNGSLSEQIQVAILGNEHLSQVFYKVQTEFSYNTDSIANATFNNKSLSSHVKYPMLVNEIENFSKSGIMRGVVLCESLNLARTVAESISCVPNCTTILGVPNATTIPPEYQKTARQFSRMAGIFFEPKNVIVVFSFEEEAALAAFDTACSNNLTFVIAVGRRSISLAEFHTGEYKAILHDKHEQLRDADGKIVQEAVEPQVKRWSTGAVGAVNKYSFKFEPSKVALDMKQKRMQFIRNLNDAHSNSVPASPQSNLTSSEIGVKKEKKPRKRPSAHNLEELPLIGMIAQPRPKRKSKVKETDSVEVIESRSVEVIDSTSIEILDVLPTRENKKKSQLKVIDPKSHVASISNADIDWNKTSSHGGSVPKSNLTKRFLKYISEEPSSNEVVEVNPIQRSDTLPLARNIKKPQPKLIEPITISDDDIDWNKTASPVGNVPRSNLTKRFLNYISDGPSEVSTNTEDLVDNKVIATYNRVLGKLDILLAM